MEIGLGLLTSTISLDRWNMPTSSPGYMRRPCRTLATAVLWGLFTALLTLAGCQGKSSSAAESAATPEATGQATVEFGIWTADAAGELYFVPTSKVPNVEDQPYGWRLRVGKSSKPVHWVEILTLPDAPESWEGVDENPNMKLSPDGRTVTTAGESTPEEGYISNTWSVAIGDPPGEYEITVETCDGRRESFKFEVREVLEESREEPDQIQT